MESEPQIFAFNAVFERELELIRQRRANGNLPAPGPGTVPTAALGLAGMALSGGGIRSASFSLGVIQGLSRTGIFKHIDYVSTVSGGGYTGSCISSLLNDPAMGSDGAEFPLRKEPGTRETAAITHLRNSSSYLSSGGLVGQLRIASLVVRGILLNFFLLMPFILFAAYLTGWDYRAAHLAGEWSGTLDDRSLNNNTFELTSLRITCSFQGKSMSTISPSRSVRGMVMRTTL